MIQRHIILASVLAILPAVGIAQTDQPYALAALDSDTASALSQSMSLSAESLAVQDYISHISAPKSSRQEAILTAVHDQYEHRKFDPIWFRDGTATEQARALVLKMRRAEENGLQSENYLAPAIGDFDGVAGLAEADVLLSLLAARFVADLSAGSLDPRSVSRLFDVDPVLPDLSDVLERLAFANDMDSAVAHYEPSHPQYRALKAKLADLSNNHLYPSKPRIEAGRSLRLGHIDPRVAILRARLSVPTADDGTANEFDPVLRDAVLDFQTTNGLTADGIVGPRTLAALNGASREEQIDAAIINMERWRWLPKDLGTFRVEVNIPEFRLRVMQEETLQHTTRVVVGKTANQTPIFSDEIEHFVVNPFWNVPTSILTKEMMPAIRSNPSGYFAKRGYQVLARVGGRTRVVNPAYINWYGVNPRSIRVRQRPGARNALGRIKFMFPNAHAVYLHDTPSKSLFKKDYRAFSHGCVRVHNPLEFAEALLAHEAEWNANRIERLYGGNERRVNLNEPIPVHLTYFTARITADGSLKVFEDVYGHDKRMRAALGL